MNENPVVKSETRSNSSKLLELRDKFCAIWKKGQRSNESAASSPLSALDEPRRHACSSNPFNSIDFDRAPLDASRVVK